MDHQVSGCGENVAVIDYAGVASCTQVADQSSGFHTLYLNKKLLIALCVDVLLSICVCILILPFALPFSPSPQKDYPGLPDLVM